MSLKTDSQSEKATYIEIRKSVDNKYQTVLSSSSGGSILSPLTIFKRCILRQIHIKHKVIILKVTWFKIIQNILATKAKKKKNAIT